MNIEDQERVIIRRIKIIHTTSRIRAYIGMKECSIVALGLILLMYVSPTHVMHNMPSVTAGKNFILFFANAFSQTERVVQLTLMAFVGVAFYSVAQFFFRAKGGVSIMGR